MNTMNINITITAAEMSTIKAALQYASEQVQLSDIPVFEDYEKPDWSDWRMAIDDSLYQANRSKAVLAEELVKKLDEAAGHSCGCSQDEDNVLKVLAYHADIGVYACEDGCWQEIAENIIMNLATGEVLEVLSSVTDENGRVVELCTE